MGIAARFTYTLAAALVTQSASAQAPASPPASAPPAAQSAADPNAIAAGVQKVKQETKMIVYPAKGQSAGQQAIDERECYVWSEQQTGIDPMVAGPNADSAAAASARCVLVSPFLAFIALVSAAAKVLPAASSMTCK